MCLDTMALVTTGVVTSADLPAKISDELLICKICYNRFSGEKLPKLLTCSHTFCEPCVQQYYKSANESQNNVCSTNRIIHQFTPLEVPSDSSSSLPPDKPFLCPLCRKETKLPENGVVGLANNFTVLSLMEILERQSLSSKSLSSTPTTTTAQYVDFATQGANVNKDTRRRQRCSSLPLGGSEDNPNNSPSKQQGVRFATDDVICVVCARNKPDYHLACGHDVCKPCSDAARLLNDLGMDQDNSKCSESTGEDNEGSTGRPQNEFSLPGQDSHSRTPASDEEPPAYSDHRYSIISNLSEPPAYSDRHLIISDNRGWKSTNNLSDNTLDNGGIENKDPLVPHRPDISYSSPSKHRTDNLQPIVEEQQQHSDSKPPDKLPPKRSRIQDTAGKFCPTCKKSVEQLPADGAECQAKPNSDGAEDEKLRGAVGDGRPPPFNPTYPKSISTAFASQRDFGAILTNYNSQSPMHRRSISSNSALYGYGSLRGHNVDYTHYDVPCPPYDIPGNLTYESPYSMGGSQIQRTQSLRRPPVPPRRDPSGGSPGLRYGSICIRHRSLSCPVPSAPGAEAANKLCGEPTYQSRSSIYGGSPPVPPPRRIYDSPQSSPVKCVKKFGKYSEVKMQTSTFQQPRTVAISEKGEIVIVDTQQMTIQVFSMGGDYLSMFKVIGVQGASFISPDRLAVATHRGVDIFTTTGERLKELPHTQGTTLNTASYKFGFIACMPKSIAIYRQSLNLHKEVTKHKIGKSNIFSKKHATFDNLKDVAVLTNKHIAVLDSGAGTIIVIDEEGITKMTINPANESCGKLKNPQSMTVDRVNHFLVSDTGNQRVLRFSNNGAFSKCILSFKSSASEKDMLPYGIAVTEHGHLIVLLSGPLTAEVRIYQLS